METATVKTAKPMHRLSGQARLKMGFTGILFPALTLLVSSGGVSIGGRHWQSGTIDQYVAMLLGWPGYSAFLPSIVYSMLSLMLWLWRDRMLQHFFIRLGLYTGVILTIQFNVLLILVQPSVVWMLIIGAAVFGLGQAALVAGIRYMLRNARRFSIRYLLIITTVTAIAIALIKTVGDLSALIQVVVAVPLLGAIASPVLSLVTMGRASVHAVEAGQSRWVERGVVAVWEVALGWLVWVTCFIIAWRIAVVVMLDEYSKLPMTRPGCYVASAAANGHPRLVKSQWVDGISMPVNNQLRRLKFLEIALKAASPKLHRKARAIYDCIGPELAALCRRSRWLSDIAYLLLRVPEAMAVSLQILFRIHAEKISDLYR